MNIKLILSITFALVALSPTCCLADLVVIAHPSTKINHISAQNARDIFMGRMNAVDGIAISPVDQEDGSKSRRDFFMSVTKKKEGQVNSHWSRMIFSGKATPMAIVGKDRDVLALIAKKPNVLGYIDESLVNDSVKVLFKVKTDIER